ncbi:MAG: hypothetical protein AB7I59_17310 [Geminicoccaceae bacterium]
MAKLPLSALVAWLVPPHGWEVAARLTPGASGRLAEKIARILGSGWAGPSAEDIARGHQLMLRIDQLAYLRCHAPWRWRPRLALHGKEHLTVARSTGKGVILWVGPTVAGPLVAKMTLHEHGIAVHHLSHPHHGLSRQTRLGRRLLNPLRTRIEDRFLRERVLLGTDNQAQAALRRLSGLLRQGETVSITVAPRGSRVLSAPFAAGRIEVASGALALAARTGAALLPVWAWRCPDGSYATRIEPPLAPAGDHQAIVRELGSQLERFAKDCPEQVQWDQACLQLPSTPRAGRAG